MKYSDLAEHVGHPVEVQLMAGCVSIYCVKCMKTLVEAERDEVLCAECGRPVEDGGGLCCTSATSEDGSHEDPVCRECCTCKDQSKIWDGKAVAGGNFRDMKID